MSVRLLLRRSVATFAGGGTLAAGATLIGVPAGPADAAEEPEPPDPCVGQCHDIVPYQQVVEYGARRSERP